MTALAEKKAAFAVARQVLLDELRGCPSGADWCLRHSELADKFLREIFEEVAGHSNEKDLVSMIAVGGYGRKELAPFSDIDLLVVPLDEADPAVDDLVRHLHRELHSAFGSQPGLSLSYAFFLVNDAPALDPKTGTAMLDSRLVCGSRIGFDTFHQAFLESLPTGEFLLEKIRERDAAHAKWNDTPLAVEPNLKEGAGGLRSLQCANWIRAAIGQPLIDPDESYNQILKVRNALHLVAGSNEDRFTRGRQADVSELCKDPLDDLMAESAKAQVSLYDRYLETLDLVSKCEYGLSAGVHAKAGEIEVEEEATLSGAAHGVAIGAQLGLEVSNAKCSTREVIDGPEALHAISTGEKTLRQLDRCGLLEKLLPELTRCRTLMPEDAVHNFSVFEHTMRAIRNIESFPSDSFYGRLRDGLSSKSALFLAALLHDVGKGIRGRPHSETGAEIAKQVSTRWGLSTGSGATVEWLVREHLTLARFIGMRDVSDPKTADEFAKIVIDRERLDMLAVLTCADVSAVAPEAWTPAQDAFLRELHGRTAALLESEYRLTDDPAIHRRRLAKTLKDHPVPEGEFERFLESLPAHYVVSTSPDLVPVHMELVRKAESGEVGVLWDHARTQNLSEVTVCVPDAPGLLSQILGVLYSFELSVHGLRASTTDGSRGRAAALDTLLVSFGNHPAPHATCTLASEAMTQVLRDGASLESLLRAHGKDPERRQEHFTFNFVEGSPGILEVQAPRGRGMAYRLAKAIAAQGWNIVSARFGQWAGKGAAAFYIFGQEGSSLTREEVEEGMSGKV